MLVLRPQHADIRQRGARRIQLGLRLGQRGGVGCSSIVLVARDTQRVAVRLHRVLQQLLQRILVAQLEVIGGQGRLRRKRGVHQVGGADLAGRHVALDLAADAAPYVQIPVKRALQRIERRRPARAGGTPCPRRAGGGAGAVQRAGRRASQRCSGDAAQPRRCDSKPAGAAQRAGDAGAGVRRGEQGRTRDIHRRLGLPQLRLELLHVLIGNRDLLFQLVQQWVMIDRPPRTLGRGVQRLRRRPAGGRLLERGRGADRVRALVIGSNGATGQGHGREAQQETSHSAGLGDAAAARRRRRRSISM